MENYSLISRVEAIAVYIVHVRQSLSVFAVYFYISTTLAVR